MDLDDEIGRAIARKLHIPQHPRRLQPLDGIAAAVVPLGIDGKAALDEKEDIRVGALAIVEQFPPLVAEQPQLLGQAVEAVGQAMAAHQLIDLVGIRDFPHGDFLSSL